MTQSLVRVVIVAGALLVLAAVNYAIVGKERVIRSGETIYLELAPVDPRSLMQGDYMALRFRLSDHIEAVRANSTLAPDVRALPLSLDARRVATRGYGDGDLAIRFRIRNGRVWLGTNAYFFAEGTAARYAGARYGEFRVRRTDGEAVLVGLADENLNGL